MLKIKFCFIVFFYLKMKIIINTSGTGGKKNASNKHQQPRPYRISSTIKIYHIEQNYRCDRLYCIAYARRKAVVEFRFNHLEYLYRFIDFFFLAFHRQINGLLVALHCPIVITYRISVTFFFLDLKC